MNGQYYSQGYPGFSFSTEPLGDHHSGSAWIQTTEGQQNFHESIPMSRLSQGAVLSGIDAQLLPLDFQDQWNTQNSFGDATLLERWISQSSVEAVGSPPMSVRTITSDHPDQAQSVELRPSLSQISFPISSGHSDITDRSFSLPDATLLPNSPPLTDVQVYGEAAYLDEMDSSVRQGSFHNGLSNDSARRQSRLMPVTTGSYTPFTSSGEETMFMSPRDAMSQAFFEHSISQEGLSPILEPLMTDDHTWAWDGGNEQSGSGVSSPFPKENAWPVPNTPNYTTNPQSQRTNGKSAVPRNSCVSMEASAIYQHSPEVTGLYSPTAPGDRNHVHGSNENEPHPRGHALYQNATIHKDGLYHCPWEESDPNCNHRPEKLKCNYDKFVDSHLKPYRCKAQACENARFSSTACLLRHEREAHAMHGHGEKPFLCTFEGCDRGTPGNGFPRHWNLCDHMKRVHNRSPSPPLGSNKTARSSRKRKHEASESGSSKKSPPNASSSAEKASAPAPTLSSNEQYEHGFRLLSSLTQDMPDPADPMTVEKLRNVEGVVQMLMAEALTSQMGPSIKLERTASQRSG